MLVVYESLSLIYSRTTFPFHFPSYLPRIVWSSQDDGMLLLDLWNQRAIYHCILFWEINILNIFLLENCYSKTKQWVEKQDNVTMFTWLCRHADIQCKFNTFIVIWVYQYDRSFHSSVALMLSWLAFSCDWLLVAFYWRNKLISHSAYFKHRWSKTFRGNISLYDFFDHNFATERILLMLLSFK